MKTKHFIRVGLLSLCVSFVVAGCNKKEDPPCTPATMQTLEVSANSICPGGGVVFSLSGTQQGVSYQLYKNDTPEGAALVGSGAAATFTGTYGSGTYTVRTVATPATCETAMTGSHVVNTYAIFNAGEIASTGETISIHETPATIGSVKDAEGGDSNITYSWYLNGETTAIAGATATTYTPAVTEVGTYTYIRKANDGACFTAPTASEGSWVLVIVRGCDAPSVVATFQDFVPCPDAATGSVWTLSDARDNKTYKVTKMPDGRIWMAQNLNFQKDLTFQENSNQPFITNTSGAPGIGSFWAPASGASYSAASGATSTVSTLAVCETYGALYTWETAMMVDGKYADDTKTTSGPEAWDEAAWIATPNYYLDFATGMPSDDNAKRNNARSGHGICPTGWHVPTDYEWAVMLDKVHGDGAGTYYVGKAGTAILMAEANDGKGAGARLKTTNACTSANDKCGTEVDPKWIYNGTFTAQASDVHGFSVIPSGQRGAAGGNFNQRGNVAYFWTATPFKSGTTVNSVFARTFNSGFSYVSRSSNNRAAASSVRCIKD